MLRADGTLASGLLQDAGTQPVGSWLLRDGVVALVLIGGGEGGCLPDWCRSRYFGIWVWSMSCAVVLFFWVFLLLDDITARPRSEAKKRRGVPNDFGLSREAWRG